MNRVQVISHVIRHLHASIIFNFKYLPFLQAIKLPFIFECRTCFYALKGTVTIECNDIKMGMIRFKSRNVGVYSPKLPFIWEHYGETIFRGRGVFKAGSAVSVGPDGKLEFANNFSIGPLNKIVCLNNIKFGENFLCAWEILIMDSDFHYILNLEKRQIVRNTKPVSIGNNCWIGTRTMIHKGTSLPANIIVGSMSILNKEYDIPEFSLLAGCPAILKSNNIARMFDDKFSQDEIEVKLAEWRAYNRTINTK